jgi:hypothetical protein
MAFGRLVRHWIFLGKLVLHLGLSAYNAAIFLTILDFLGDMPGIRSDVRLIFRTMIS